MNSTEIDFNIFNQCFNTSQVVILISDVLYMLCMQFYVYKIYKMYVYIRFICMHHRFNLWVANKKIELN